MSSRSASRARAAAAPTPAVETRRDARDARAMVVMRVRRGASGDRERLPGPCRYCLCDEVKQARAANAMPLLRIFARIRRSTPFTARSNENERGPRHRQQAMKSIGRRVGESAGDEQSSR